jgi:hypothetical protein
MGANKKIFNTAAAALNEAQNMSPNNFELGLEKKNRFSDTPTKSRHVFCDGLSEKLLQIQQAQNPKENVSCSDDLE